jgi:hypothetical protein
MADETIEGSLEILSFGRLLTRIWEARLTGRLTITIHEAHEKKSFYFFSGSPAATPDALSNTAFGLSLVQSGIAANSTVKNAAARAKKENITFFKALLQQNMDSSHQIWNHAEFFFRREFMILFAPSVNLFSFQEGEGPHPYHRLFLLDIPELILEGSRGISDYEQLRKLFPRGKEALHLRSSPVMDKISNRLSSMETYVKGLVDGQLLIEELISQSQLEEKETEKILLLLFNLGALETRLAQTENSTMGRLTPSDIKALVDILNQQSIAIFKYISKEIGPVAQTVLDKHIQDTKTHISPLFQHVRFLQEGCLDIQPLLNKQALLTNKKVQSELLRSLNEILAAEILAVRTTLGGKAVGPLIEILNKLPILTCS